MPKKISVFLDRNMGNLLVAASFLGVTAMGLLMVNWVNLPSDVAFAQNNPENPGGGTVVVPGDLSQPSQPVTNPEPTTGVNTPTTGNTSTDTTGNPTTTPNQTGTASGGNSAPTPTTPDTPTADNETIVEGSGEVVNIPVGDTPTPTQSDTPTQPATPTANEQVLQAAQNSGSTARSGGLTFAVTGLSIIGLGGWYYYYHQHGDQKHTLKMEEKKIKSKKR